MAQGSVNWLTHVDPEFMQAWSCRPDNEPMLKIPSSCDFCKTGHIAACQKQIVFRQLTNKGYVLCRVSVPMAICERCGSMEWNKAAETIIEGAVREEYEKLLAQHSSDEPFHCFA